MGFNIGDRVVCLTDHTTYGDELEITKGNYYTIMGVKKCSCGTEDVDIGCRMANYSRLKCQCGDCEISTTWWLKATRFTKIDDTSEVETVEADETVEEFMEIFNTIKTK